MHGLEPGTQADSNSRLVHAKHLFPPASAVGGRELALSGPGVIFLLWTRPPQGEDPRRTTHCFGLPQVKAYACRLQRNLD